MLQGTLLDTSNIVMRHDSCQNESKSFTIFSQTASSKTLYEPLIDVISPHTCIPNETEYVPLSVLDKQSSNSLSAPPSLTLEKPSIPPVDSIQNRKRKANSDEYKTGGTVKFYLPVHWRKMLKILVKIIK